MQTITITPDYEALAANMLRAAGHAARSLTRSAGAEALRDIQGILAPLNVAAQAITTTQTLEDFRAVLAGIVTSLDERANTLEAAEETTPREYVVTIWRCGEIWNRAVIATEEKAREYAEQAEAHSIDYRATVEAV